MATYVLDGKTARIFAEVKSARARAVKRKVWGERVKTGSETGPKGVWGLRAFRENLTPLLRVFAKPIMTKQTRPVFQSTYVALLQKVKKDVIYTETVYNNKSFDKK